MGRARRGRSWRTSSVKAEVRSGRRRRERIWLGSVVVGRFRDWTARIDSVDRVRPRWIGPRLSRGPDLIGWVGFL